MCISSSNWRTFLQESICLRRFSGNQRNIWNYSTKWKISRCINILNKSTRLAFDWSTTVFSLSKFDIPNINIQLIIMFWMRTIIHYVVDHIKENNSLSKFPVSFILWSVYYVMYGNIFNESNLILFLITSCIYIVIFKIKK